MSWYSLKEFSIISLYEVFKVHACSTSGAIPMKWILWARSHMIHFLRNHSATARSWARMHRILRMFDCRTVRLINNLSGDGEIRTHDPLLARQVLSQLSYTPKCKPIGSFWLLSYSLVITPRAFQLLILGLNGLEPSTSRLSGVRSNQLSYKPKVKSLQTLLF